jgi:outer membrane protein TolC
MALLVLLPAAAAGQPGPDAPLTLRAAVDLALRTHPAVREAGAGSAAAAGEIAVARTAYLPRLDALWQVNRATRNNVFGLLLPQPVIPAVSGPVLATDTLDGVWSSAGGLLLSWEALDFGRRGAAVDVARAESSLADAQRTITALEVAGAAADAFLRVLAADAALSAARANVRRLEAFATTVGALVDAQLRAGAERSRADAELAAARSRAIEAERNAELARLSLADAVGASGTRVEVNAGALLQVPPPSASLSSDPAVHPRAAAAQAEIGTARARERALAASALPRLELQGAFSGRGVSRQIDGTPSGSALGWQVPNWAVGLSITFPGLEILRTEARRDVEASRLQEATARYDRTVQSLTTQQAQARTITAAAVRVAANTPQQLQAARAADAQARARYDAGLTTVVEVADAQRLLADAEAEDAVASLAVWRARLAEAMLRGDLASLLNQIP